MTGPVVEPGRVEMPFSEMEEQLKAIEAEKLNPDLSKVVMQGEGLPEHLKGKSALELIEYARGVEAALKVSEGAREQALATARLATESRSAPVVPAPVVEKPKQLTKEELKELYDTDPLAAIEVMNAQAIDRAAEHFSKRLEPIMTGGAQTAENAARAKYPDEFAVFEKEIKEVVASMDQSSLSSLGTWDNLIAFTRGKDYMRLVNHVTKRETDKRAAEALEAERGGAGFSATSTRRAPAPVGGKMVLDATQKEIAANLKMTDEEYIHWSNPHA